MASNSSLSMWKLFFQKFHFLRFKFKIWSSHRREHPFNLSQPSGYDYRTVIRGERMVRNFHAQGAVYSHFKLFSLRNAHQIELKTWKFCTIRSLRIMVLESNPDSWDNLKGCSRRWTEHILNVKRKKWTFWKKKFSHPQGAVYSHFKLFSLRKP